MQFFRSLKPATTTTDASNSSDGISNSPADENCIKDYPFKGRNILSIMSRPPKVSSSIFRKAHVQIICFVIVALCTLGPYNGLNALGGAGLRDHLLATKMNVFYTASLAVFGWIGGILFSILGSRKSMAIASICYISYLAILVCVQFLNIPSMTCYLGGAMMGFGASLLWAVFGVITIRFPTPENRQAVFTFLWSLINLSGFLCGLISFLKNIRDSAGAESSLADYLVFLGIMIFGFFFGLITLRHHNKVVRTDGTPVNSNTPLIGDEVEQVRIPSGGDNTSVSVCLSGGNDMTVENVNLKIKNKKKTFWSLTGRLFIIHSSDLQLLFLFGAFFCPFVHAPWLFNGVNGTLFNIRSRSINSSVYWLARVLGALIFYKCSKSKSESRSVQGGVCITYIWATISTCIGIYATIKYFNVPYISVDDSASDISYSASTVLLDYIEDFPEVLLPMSLFFLFGSLDACIQSLIYKLLGLISKNSTLDAAKNSGLFKSVQSVGSCAMWILDWQLTTASSPMLPSGRYAVHMAVVVICWLVSFPGVWCTAGRVVRNLRRQIQSDEKVYVE